MKVIVLVLSALLSVSCSKKEALIPPPVPAPEEVKVPAAEVPKADNQTPAKPNTNVAKEVEELIYEHDLFKYPEVTVLLAVKDAQRTARLIVEGGGKIVYDPNLSTGHDVGFLIADLPPKKIIEAGFVKSLDLRAMELDRAQLPDAIKPNAEEVPATEEDLFVPWKDIKIDQLRKREGNTRGKGMVVAVIDTGVDPSHYAFQNRVIYWNDLTREGRTAVKKAELKAGKLSFDGVDVAVPAALDLAKPIYQGSFSEKALSVQFSLTRKLKGDAGFDIDGNGLFDDEFRFFVGSTKGSPSESVAYVDSDGDKKFSEAELKSPVIDFNRARAAQRVAKSFLKSPLQSPTPAAGVPLLVFPSRHKTRAYPIVFTADSKGDLVTLTLGTDLEQHGTHVAGIIAGNDGKQIEGAAPEAEIMSLKVCSGISCSEQAILRGLVEAFYNPEGIVPDVVNISLGSSEGYEERTFNILMRDLAAKFGATFFVSASNEGPGYRSLNAFAATGPEIMVGAYVSRNTLMKHYTLDAGLDVPEHTLHYFSSVGPSYTGQLRPNIVAPGSAISSIPMALGGSAMFNGTSMASPIAAGSAAAMLGLSRTANDGGEIIHPEIRQLEARRRAKVSAILNREPQSEQYSNISVPLMVRTALEDKATAMPHYTAAQRGHGLINIDAAYEGFLELSKKVNAGEAVFADFRVNENARPGLYDRQFPIANARKVLLTLESDGEATRETYFLNNQALTVTLARVEVQDTDGKVTTLEGEAALTYFAIARRGVEEKPARDAALVLSDTTKNYFISVRKPSAYEVGKTYLAHYHVSRAGQRLFSLLDVVHNPITLSNTATVVDIPALDVDQKEKIGAFVVKDRVIGANSFHRYPIAVTSTDARLSVQLAISPDAGGSVAVSVYDADGHKVGGDTASRSPQMPKDPAEKRIAQVTVDSSKGAGIYEVVVAAAGSRWNGPSKYNLLVEPSRFALSAKSVKLSTGESTTVVLSSPQVRTAFATVTDLERLETVKVGLLSQHWTFRKVPMPAAAESGPEFMRLELTTAVEDAESANFSGDLVPALYHLQDGKPVVAHKASKGVSNSGKLVFEDVERSGPPVYFAVETYANLKSSKSPTLNTVPSYSVDIVYSGMIVKQEGTLAVTPATSKDPSISIFSVVAPKKLTELPAGNHKAPRARATLRISSDAREIKAEIPITIVQ